MKLKHFDRYQHYYLDKIWDNIAEGKDVAAMLQKYADWQDGFPKAQDIIEVLDRQLRDYPAIDPDHGKWRTWGFVVPFHGQDPVIKTGTKQNEIGEEEDVFEPALAFQIHEVGALIICVEKREKVLPSSAINDKLMERAKEMAEREERELNRKDYAILKEEVTASLLKTAPVRRSRIYVMFDRADLIVFTSSQKAAEETTALIRTAFSSLPTVPAYNSEIALQQFFKKILQHDDEVYEKFMPGTTVKLRNDEGEVVTVKDGDIDDNRYTDLLKQGFVVHEMEIQYLNNLPGMEHIWVKMNHKGDIKSFSTSADSDSAEFEDQYERGNMSFQSKMAELWVLHLAMTKFNSAMDETGVMVNRSKLQEIDDGDIVALEKQASDNAKVRKAKADMPDEPETEEDPEDDDWDI